MSPTVQHSVHRNMSAPSSPVHNTKSDHRALTSHAGIGLHHQQSSFPHVDTTRIHTSISDHGRYADMRHSDAKQAYTHGGRSRVDREYTDYAYVRAAAMTHPQTKDAFVDYRVGGNRDTDDIYMHSHRQGQWAERSQEVEGRVNNHRPMDGNLYHLASSRTASYASSDELQPPLPVTAAATSSRFLDPMPHWTTSKHASLEGGYWQHNGDMSNPNLHANPNPNLYGGSLGVGNSPYGDSDARLQERSHDAVPPPRQLRSPHIRYETPPHVHAAAAETSCSSVELSPAEPSAIILRGQNCVEVSKPFEMADVYKYSSRVRRTDVGGDRTADLRSTSSPHLTNYARESQYRERPAYVAPNPQYPPSRHYRKPIFD